LQCSADYLARSNATPPPGRILSWTAALVASIVIDAVRALFHLYLGRTADPGGLAAAPLTGVAAYFVLALDSAHA